MDGKILVCWCKHCKCAYDFNVEANQWSDWIPAETMAECNQCENGRTYFDGEYDVCYHCSGTGRIDEEQAQRDRQSALIAELAQECILNQKRLLNASDHDGEDWRFMAAENMMTERDYTQARMMDQADRLTQMVAEKIDEKWRAGVPQPYHFHSLNELRAILGWPLKVEGSTVNDPKTPTDEDVRAD